MRILSFVRWATLVLGACTLAAACAKAQTDFSDTGPESCPAGQELCGDFCAAVALDPNHCGGCFLQCKAGEVCSEGACAASCGGGTTQCGEVCADTMLDPANCGECGKTCPAGETCAGGACGSACAADKTSCAGECVDTLVDPRHCGACGMACAEGELCSEGACGIVCAGSTVQCGMICTNTQFDPSHCGGCGMACPGGINMTPVCAAGYCDKVCAKGFANCNGQSGDGCEVATSSNAQNCGACGVVCSAPNASAKCDMGACALGACNAGFADCDKAYGNGCEVDTQSSVAHCGACGNACAMGKLCQAGVCVDKPTSATCVDLVTNEPMWGKASKGIDLRKWTGSTLHYLGCNGDGCSPDSFFCNYDPVNKTLEFGANGTVRAMVDPGNAQGELMATNYSGCCQANQVLGLCNAPDANNNGINVNNALALCNALGYQSGVIVAWQPDNSCPEAHAVDASGKNWSSDYVNSLGYGHHWKCTGF